LGVILIYRHEVRPFTESQIALLETFADQAAIAIENARLLTELQTKNASLTEALEQQTATSEILRVISSSPTDVQPVFDIIAERAVKLCDAEVSVTSRFDGHMMQLAAVHGVTQEGTDALRRIFPMRLDAEAVTARTYRERGVVHVEDVMADASYEIKDTAGGGGGGGGRGGPRRRRGGGGVAGRPNGARRAGHRSHLRWPIEAWIVQRTAGRAAEDLCGPGGHRRPECAPVHGAGGAQQRAAGGLGAADGDQRAAQGDR